MKIYPEMFDVVCAGCGGTIGISESKTPLRNKVFHDTECLDKKPARANSLRDQMIVKSRKEGTPISALAKTYGLSRQRVHSIVKSVTETQ